MVQRRSVVVTTGEIVDNKSTMQCKEEENQIETGTERQGRRDRGEEEG